MIAGILVCTAAGAPTRPTAPRCKPTGVDRPDLRFVDANCDGIDGDARTAVFVAPNGKNGAPGTPAQPLRTISAALVVAKARGGDVYAAAGTYDEGAGLLLSNGVSIFGGYGRTWKRRTSLRTLIVGSPQAIIGDGVRGVTLQLLSAKASAAKKDELSVYGVRLVRSTAIILDHVTITTGAGRPGARGSNPGGEGVSGRADESDRPGASAALAGEAAPLPYVCRSEASPSARAVLEEVQP